MAKRDIYLRKDVLCPACRKQSQTRYPNPRLYAAGSKESDMRVVSYRWAEGAESDVKPHYFAVWQCPNCMFADLADSVLGSQKPDGFALIVDAFNHISLQQRMMLASLRKLVNAEEIDLQGAMAMHLTALFTNELIEKERRNHSKIGRIALRVAWLFRETGGETGTSDEEDSAPLKGLKEGVSRLEQYVLSFSDKLGEMNSFAERRVAELGLKEDAAGNDSNPYSSIFAGIFDKTEELQTLLTILQRTLLQDSKGEISSSHEVDESMEGSLTESLLSLREGWPELPVHEEQALRRAIDAFDYSYNHENVYHSIEQSMSVVNLIVDLYQRVGEHEKALNYVAEIYKSGMRTKQELQGRLKKGRQSKSVTPHDERMINRKISNINVAIRQAGDTRREMINTMLTQKTPEIKEAMAGKSSPEAQIEALRSAGIAEELINELKNRNIIKSEKKRGLFGFGG